MDFERLKVFLAIIDSGSMTAAAEKLRLTQPALSRALKTLEDDLGVALFERVGRGLVLSQAGRAMENDARTILDNLDAMGRRVKKVGKQKFFDLRLGGVDSVVGAAFPDVVSRLRSEYKDINIKIYADRSPSLVRRIERDELDFAVVAWHGTPPAHVSPRKLVPYQLRYYGRKDKFKGLDRAKTLREIAEYPVILLDGSMDDPSCTPQTDSFAVTNSMASTKALVLSGFGVGALVEFMLADIEREQLVAARYDNEGEDCFLWLVSSPGNSLTAGLIATLSSMLKARLSRPASSKNAL